MSRSELDCGVCQKAMEEPRLLSCLHTYCTDCLIRSSYVYKLEKSRLELTGSVSWEGDNGTSETSQEEDKVDCPKCEKVTILPKVGVHGLPVNYKIQNKLNQSTSHHCQLCSSEALAFCKCEECVLLMCSICAETHVRFGDVGSHTILQLNETPLKLKVVAKEEGYCLLHPSEEARYFCCTCLNLVCSGQCSGVHAGHQLETLSQATSFLTAAIASSVDKSMPSIDQASKTLNIIKTLENRITDRSVKVQQEIEFFIESYKDELDKHKENLLREVETIQEKRINDLHEHNRMLIERITSAKRTIEFAEDILNDSSPAEVLSVAGYLLKNLENACLSNENRAISVSNYIQFLPDKKSPLFRTHQTYGIVSTQSICPQNSSLNASGLLGCRQHKKTSFVLVTRDIENKPLCHGGEKVTAELKYKDASQRSLVVSVTDEGDGTYVLSFTPDTSGILLLSIFIQETHIEGSPYSICVSTLRQHKGIFHCCAFCSSGGNKTASCACGCKMIGGYKGCGHGHIGHPGRRHWSCCANVLQNSECSRPIVHQCSF